MSENDHSVNDVKHEITNREVADLSKAALAAEWREAYESLNAQVGLTDEERNQLWNRRRELWNEMKRRTDAEPPECPGCSGQQWSQTIGGPKTCDGCGLYLGERHSDTIQAIDEYWRKVQAVPEEADA